MPDEKPTINDLEKQILLRSAKDAAFRTELLADPKGIFSRELLKAFPDAGPLPPNVKIKVVEQTDDTLYLVLPKAPEAACRELGDEELAGVAGGCVCTNPIFNSFFSSW
jgi:hypothetical protein